MAVVQDLKAVLQVEDKNFQSRLKNAERDTNKFTSSMKKMGLAIAAAFTVNAIKNFAVESASLADKQLKAEASLLTALGGRELAQKRLIAQAQELQGKTLFGDEVTIEAQAVAASLGLTEKQILALMPQIQNMATVLKMDLSSATSLVAKSVTSSTNAMARYGIEIEGAAGSSERAQSAVEALTSKFDGQAEAAAKVGLGPLTQLKNIIGDVKEVYGQAVINGLNPFIQSAIEMFTPSRRLYDQAVELEKQIPKTAEEFAEYAKKLGISEKAAEGLAKAQQDLIDQQKDKIFKEVQKDVKKLTWEYETATKAVKNLTATFESIADGTDNLTATYKKYITTNEVLVNRTKDLKKINEELVANLIWLKEKGVELNESQQKLISTYEEEIKVKGKLEEQQEAENKLRAEADAKIKAETEARLKNAEAKRKQYEELSKLSRLSETQFQFKIQEEAFAKFEELTKKAGVDYDQLVKDILASQDQLEEKLPASYDIIMQEIKESIVAMQMISEQIIAMGTQSLIGLTSAFGELAATWGQVESGGREFGASILSIFGGFMKQLGQLMITTSIMAKKFQAQLFTPGPGAIAAGIALVALGSAFSKKASAMTQSMGSGGGGGTASTSMGGRGMSTDVTRLAGPPVNIEGEFQIRGRDLVMVLEKANYSNSKTRG